LEALGAFGALAAFAGFASPFIGAAAGAGAGAAAAAGAAPWANTAKDVARTTAERRFFMGVFFFLVLATGHHAPPNKGRRSTFHASKE
jgi:hypothetical protein